MKVCGSSTDGMPVVSDVFSLCGTHGLPLEIVIDKAREEGFIISWPDYINDALRDGHNLKTIKSRIEAAIGDCYGPDYKVGFMKRLDEYLEAVSCQN